MATSTALSAAIVLAAGKGTRIKSQTPKVLLEMCGRTLVGHVNDAVRELHPEHLVYVVRHERDQVVAHLSEINPEALIADQDDVKGTGRAAWCGMQVLDPNFQGAVLVVAGDCPMLSADALAGLVAAHEGNAVTILSTVVADPFGYGRILRAAAPNTSEISGTAHATGVITGIVEEKDATAEQRQICEINTSTYVFDVQFLRESLDTLDTDNAQGEMYLTDVISRAAQMGVGVGSYVLADSMQAEGVNDLVQLATLRKEKNRRILEHWMRSGVSIVDPETTWVDVDVVLEADARIEPGSVLRGTTKVEAFAVVGPHSELVDAHIGHGATVPHSIVHSSTVAAGGKLAPFSVLGTLQTGETK